MKKTFTYLKAAVVCAVIMFSAAKVVNASCDNKGSANNGHCRADGNTGTCVESYWFESDNCKKASTTVEEDVEP